MTRGIGVDWGSSNARAWVFGDGGEILAESTAQIDFSEAKQKGFERCFEELVRPLAAFQYLPVVACGMVGARGGWQEVPYVRTPRALNDVVAQPFSGPNQEMYILPGVSTSSPAPDVMRGEETQICGAALLGHSGWFCLPGTHSKWANVEDQKITEFKTFVTGELFSLSQQHAIYGALSEDGVPDWDSFKIGVQTAIDTPLLSALFQTRSRVLCEDLTPQQSTWFMSGCLIGSEVFAAKPAGGSVTLIADGRLRELYATALTSLKCEFTLVSAERCTTHALFFALKILEKVAA
ncbi:2-dehydro-3-deoxygalactonokinase [Phaeobacter sp. C3_T13_0]|uniref:2-dehydro-3-deoxygalactonokinase n=1 Tax=Phaeobacter cretensis TaxID=3342641 RepID=UPI0039BC5DAF